MNNLCLELLGQSLEVNFFHLEFENQFIYQFIIFIGA